MTGTVSMNPVCYAKKWQLSQNQGTLHEYSSKSLTRCGHTLFETVCLSSLFANSGRMSSSAMRVPRSGLAKSFMTGSIMVFVYSSGDTFLPSWTASGRIVEPEEAIAGFETVSRRNGRTRFVANVTGSVGATSLIVLRRYKHGYSLGKSV